MPANRKTASAKGSTTTAGGRDVFPVSHRKGSAGVPPASSKHQSGQDGRAPLRDRRKQTLFIDARKPGTLIDRVHRELTDAEVNEILELTESLSQTPQLLPILQTLSGESSRAPAIRLDHLRSLVKNTYLTPSRSSISTASSAPAKRKPTPSSAIFSTKRRITAAT